MSHVTELVVRTTTIGVGATLVMDAWGAVLRRLGVRTLDFAMLGRWIGHLPEGQWVHDGIARAAPIEGERLLGWTAHYAIGVTFAAILVAVFGLSWARSPSLGPALGVGVVTALAPLLVLQPALGAGIASSRTATPVFNAMKSVASHAVFGLGLYLSARAAASLFPPAE